MIKSVRIARYKEFDNGRVLHDYKKMDVEQAELLAKEESLKNPDDIFYVKFDDIMNPDTDFRWVNGKKYLYSQVKIRNGVPKISGSPIGESRKINEARFNGYTVRTFSDLWTELKSKGLSEYEIYVAGQIDMSPLTIDNLKISQRNKYIAIGFSGDIEDIR